MEMKLVVQGKNDEPRLADIPEPIFDFSKVSAITFCLIEEGMVSGDPSVIIVSETDQGSVILQTSLDKFLAGAMGMVSAAETHWGWKVPEGYATLMPTDPATRKELLKAIKKELEEWDEDQT